MDRLHMTRGKSGFYAEWKINDKAVFQGSFLSALLKTFDQSNFVRSWWSTLFGWY